MSAKKIIEINDLTKKIDKFEALTNRNNKIGSLAFFIGVALAFYGKWVFVGICAAVFLAYSFAAYKGQDVIDQAKEEKRILLNELED